MAAGVGPALATNLFVQVGRALVCWCEQWRNRKIHSVGSFNSLLNYV